jgi:hypothetical protein
VNAPVIFVLLPPVEIDMETGLEVGFDKAHFILPPVRSRPGDSAGLRRE